MEFHYGAKCGDCQNCMMRRINLPDTCFVINREPLGFTYDIYCQVTDNTISLHSERAELCEHFKNRENDNEFRQI